MDLVNAHVLGWDHCLAVWYCYSPVPLSNMIISGHWDRKIRFWDHRTASVNPNHELTIQGRVSSLSLFPGERVSQWEWVDEYVDVYTVNHWACWHRSVHVAVFYSGWHLTEADRSTSKRHNLNLHVSSHLLVPYCQCLLTYPLIVDSIYRLTGAELALGIVHCQCMFMLYYHYDIMYSPDGQYVAAGSSDGSIHVWETMTGKLKTKKEPSVHTLVTVPIS